MRTRTKDGVTVITPEKGELSDLVDSQSFCAELVRYPDKVPSAKLAADAIGKVRAELAELAVAAAKDAK